ncbi:MAG: ATP-dependent helicase [Kiritimatiellae bacterium]|nr:ATP-dependent helicase [Kiritimatiellia bacterium]
MTAEPKTKRGTVREFPWLDELNPPQREAVTHGEGPLLVVAGAGSGKTRTLAYRVAWLIATGTQPGRILLLTFTRRAAQEMLTRAAAVVRRGTAFTGRVWGGTFHATANRLLRIYAKAAGLPREFTVMDETDAEDMMNVIRHDLNLHTKDKRFPRKSTCLAIYSRCVNGTEPLGEVLRRFFPWCVEWEAELKTIFQHYVKRKQDRNVLDYDDLLLYWAQILNEPAVARQIEERFDHILVDEYQDTNPIQAEILRGMRRTNHNITAVGDDAQSIYSFRAATVRNMLDFPKHFPGTRIVTLEQNYRSVPAILEVTNRVIAGARERFTKDLWSAREKGRRPLLVTCRDEAQQDEYVVDRILEHYEQGIPLRKQAVLFRASHLSDTLEVELTRRNIPYRKYGGLRFLEAAHVKDLLAFLRILENPRDEMAWFRVLQMLEGIGHATAARIIRHVATHHNSLRSLAEIRPPPAAAETFAGLVALFEDLLTAAGHAGPAAQIQRVRQFYEPLLPRLYENPQSRARDLANLEQAASGYRSLQKFLNDLQLDPPSATSDLAGPPVRDEDWLVLSTIHSAKGCEWDVVYLIHAADGFLPSDMACDSEEEIEEERRLTYVAMTRARDFLYVTWPLRYYSRWRPQTDRHVYSQLSRFIDQHVQAAMDCVFLAQPEEVEFFSGSVVRRDAIRSRIRSMWQ